MTDAMSLVVRNRLFAYAKTKTQISFTVTAKLMSAFVFATRKVQSLYYLNPKFQASNHLLWLYSPVCVGPGWKPRRPVFSERGSNLAYSATGKCKKFHLGHHFFIFCFTDFFRNKLGSEDEIKIKNRGSMVL